MKLLIESIFQGEAAEPGMIKLLENYKYMPYNISRNGRPFNCTVQLMPCLNSAVA